MTTFISIHALRGEGDVHLILLLQTANISIHALRGEGDLQDPAGSAGCPISIHALRGEGDAAGAVTSPEVIKFLSTPSVGRAT